MSPIKMFVLTPKGVCVHQFPTNKYSGYSEMVREIFIESPHAKVFRPSLIGGFVRYKMDRANRYPRRIRVITTKVESLPNEIKAFLLVYGESLE